MKSRGVTLVELIVVISIISILVVALGFSYVGWQGKYKVEKAVKELYADLMTARSMAMTRGRMHFARCISPFTSYSLYDDTSDGTLPNGDENLQTTGALPDTLLLGFPKTVEYPLTWGVGVGLGRIQFHKDGLIDTSAAGSTGPWTIYMNSTSSPDYDCVVISQTRIDMGKWNTTTVACDVK